MADPQISETETLLIVMTTVSTAAQAQVLARTLVEEHLVACAQILPQIHSIYRWQGQIESEGEVLIWLKLPTSRYNRLAQRLGQIHPYQEPEVIVLGAAQVSPSYLAWAQEQTQI